ncbi:MAG: PLP-dependent aminotransferase family protein [Betaproteobacteria bacterium]|nr:PLP-dependent aminotransferase family protein [Betaproteobacteria bacterium]
MAAELFDYAELLRPDLPPATARWTDFPKYNFVGGHNDADSVPVEGLIAAATTVLKREGRTLSTYGLQSGPLGYRPLREFIARKLANDAGIACSPDEILITSGSLQGLDLVNQVLLSPGDTVIVEQMTYGGAITRLKRLGVNIVGVEVDHDGLSSDGLKTALDDLKRRGIRPKYIYTIPTVQNPTATVMSEARRTEILGLSVDYGAPVFEDECYADLVWEGTRPRALRGMVSDDRVIHIGSFSKSIAPALRIGYLVTGWPLMSRILGIKSDGGSGALEQMILAEYCQDHFESHVRALRKTLRRKLDVMIEALRTQFGAAAKFDDPAGGIFLWVTLPDGVDTTRLTQLALQSGVAINPGAEWMIDAGAGQTRLRLCFAHPSEQGIREGVARLAEVCHREFAVPARSAKAHR